MKIIRVTLLLISFGVAAAASAQEVSEWQTLFNGKDLTGWQANRLPESWTIENGLLKAHCQDPDLTKSHLFYVGDRKAGFVRFKDFELEATVRGEPGSNSGIFFHTDATVRDDKHHLGNGYEVQLNNQEKVKGKTGSLYAIVNFDESPVDETEWFTVRIKVQGKRIVVHVNNSLAVDYTEPENPERPKNRAGRLLNPEGGAIALQAHDPASIYYFKEIRIRRLE
jgi:hypothetical protein